MRAPADVNEQTHQHETNPPGQTVDAVDKIHEIGHAHEPKQRGGQAQETQHMIAAGDRISERIEAESAVKGQHPHQHLQHQLFLRAQRTHVIDQPDGEHGQRREDQREGGAFVGRFAL